MVVLFTVLMGLIKLQDKHRFTPHGIVCVEAIKFRILREYTLFLIRTSNVLVEAETKLDFFIFFLCFEPK